MTGTSQDETTVDPAEISKFEAMATEWWDPAGKFRPLHAMNPCRLDYIVSQIAACHGRDPARLSSLAGLRVLDIGCGGGLLCEPLTRLGAEVTGIDPAEASIAVARVHAGQAGLDIDYRATTAEALAAEGTRFDAVLAMEVVEHLPDPRGFLATCARLVRPDGPVIVSTLNRTALSYAVAIVGAEQVLGWLPRGTHDWNRFLKPAELEAHMANAGLAPVDRKGMVFDPVRRDWRLSPDALAVNYVVTAVPGALSTP
jgi:2-polyprenyl-6-hydroxyphenyl methylase/3-demethylubiquinone-9 3-methyltransferase